MIAFAGYILTWASVNGRVTSSYGAIFVWQLIVSHGHAWLDLATMCPSMLNFKTSQGAVSGEKTEIYFSCLV